MHFVDEFQLAVMNPHVVEEVSPQGLLELVFRAFRAVADKSQQFRCTKFVVYKPVKCLLECFRACG